MPTNKAHAQRAKAAVSDMLDTFEHNGPDDPLHMDDIETLEAARSMLRGAQALIGKTWKTSYVFRGDVNTELDDTADRITLLIDSLKREIK